MKKLSLILIAVLLISLLCGTMAGAADKTVTFTGAKSVSLKAENTDGRIFARLLNGSELVAVKVISVATAPSKVALDFGGKTGTVSFVWVDSDLCPVSFTEVTPTGPVQGDDELNIA